MKTLPTSQLMLQLSTLAIDYQCGRISKNDYEMQRQPLRAELQRRLKKSSLSEAA